MAKTQADRQRELREHYRQFLEERNGRPYNVLLDNPQDPENFRHWTHGSADGYMQAGCRCVPDPEEVRSPDSKPKPPLTCTEANTRYSDDQRLKRLDRRVEEHRGIISLILAAAAPTLSPDTIDDGTDTVLQAGRVVSREKAKIVYDRPALELALRAWNPPGLERDVLLQLATALDDALNTR